MRFTVEAVPAQQFDQWVTAAHNSGPVLDAQAYAELARPSQAVAPFTYRAVAPGLFSRVVSAELPPCDPSRCIPPESARAER